ncbi:Por secretion system C-terminal sorting domain-containing protein [Dyadobacter koreensis]|uniref:Por secretion system C-terminal sorting domain-containing protein n=1 Tax=Dyadobacter koreensis TaxID=408657 RepID=A0A1H7B056_9BACT|nr:S8 family serine peptidase [Dyadobacter koreensis]SEJ71213.1 Por secretion system C-terminal sorting domain-containing protein [Dyadobacter koreensis]
MYDTKFYLFCLALFFNLSSLHHAEGQVKPVPKLYLKSGTIVPENNISENLTKSGLRTSGAGEKSLVIIHFDKVPAESTREELKNAGVELLDYIPDNAYTATVSNSFDLKLLKKTLARSIITLSPDQKMQAALANNHFPVHAEKVAGKIDLWLNFPKSFSFEEVKKELLSRKIEIISENLKGYQVVEIRIPKTLLKEIAGLPFVQYIQAIPGEEKSYNYRSIASSRANALTGSLPLGFNLKGEGVTIGVGDNADPQQHIDFSTRVINHSGIKGNSHGVHVIGTIAGAGIVDERYTGYAPKSRVVAQINSNIWANAGMYVRDYGMVITNNSYGVDAGSCSDFGDYTLTSKILDQQAFDFPYLQHVFAAGNSGLVNLCAGVPSGFGNVLGGYTSAKNVITVGNALESGILNNISSKGPTKDGRMKPDLTATGSSVISTVPTDQYNVSTGTSMASASVSGGLVLMYQRYRQLHNGNNPQNALMKALLCNGATDQGLAGPDYGNGYGGINLLRSIKMLDQNSYFESGVSNGSAAQHTIKVPANTAQLKVMLYWNDPAPSVLSGKALVNNLDLRVISPDSPSLLPQLLDPKNILSAAGNGTDDTNNMEQIVINNPGAGDYTIVINGTTVTQGNQNYVVVYDNIPVSTALTYPAGQEHLASGEDIYINWDAYGNDGKTFKIEYSLNNGGSWTSIQDTVNADLRQIKWTLPAVSTSGAKVRIKRDGTDIVSESEPFTILGVPAVALSPTQCEGYIAIQWPAIDGASDYEIMTLKGDEMSFWATTTSTSFALKGLSKDSTYYVSVRARINGNPGRRSPAIIRKPNQGNCEGSISDNDLKLETIISPAQSGRIHTSSELSASNPVTIRIKNLDDQVSDQNIQVGYSIGDDNSTIIWETIKPSIQPGGTYDHTFAATANLGDVASYRFRVFVKKTGDPVEENNAVTQIFKQLDNAPVTLPFMEQFENYPVQQTNFKQVGLIGGDRFDIIGSTAYGRLRTYVGSDMAYSGSRALTLDVNKNVSAGNVNYLVGTFNLSQFNPANDDLRLSFWFNNHGQYYNENDKVWIRAKDTDPWIEADNLYVYHSSPGEGYKRAVIQLSKILTSNSKTFSASFQIRFGQYGEKVTANQYGGAGYSFDDIQITKESNDIELVKIIPPVSNNLIYNNQRISVVVRNNSAGDVYDVPIKLQMNNGTVVSQNISYIKGEADVTYQFSNIINFSSIGTYSIKVWTENNWDSKPDNNSVQIDVVSTAIISSFPYLQNFEAEAGNWQSAGINNSWAYGSPVSAKINSAASGSKAWKTNLSGTYNASEKSFLYSPGFAIAGMSNPTLSFSLAIDLKKCPDKLCDFAYVEYSTDGNIWTKLGIYGSGTNWYNLKSDKDVWSVEDYTRWHVSTVPIPQGLKNVRFRFAMQSDDSDNREGIAIDDVHIYDLANPIYSSGPESSTVSKSDVNGASWINFTENDKIIASIQPNQDLGKIVVQTYLNQAAVRNSNGQYYHNRNFTIKPESTSFSEFAVIRLYFTDSETEQLLSATGCGGCAKPASAYDLAISKYSDFRKELEDGTLSNNTNGSWSLLSADDVVKVPYDNGYYVEFKTKSLSEFWLAKGSLQSATPLPVELTRFTAKKVDVTEAYNSVLLEWTTAAEKDFSHFEIEMASGEKELNQSLFTKIGEVNGKANSASITKYQFTDQQITGYPTRYYRLKMVDKDETFNYSAIRSVTFSEKVNWRVYPNPSNGVFNVDFQTEKSNLVNVNVFDVSGRLLEQKTIISSGSLQTQQINISGAAVKSGIYFLEIMSGQQKQVFKILKE